MNDEDAGSAPSRPGYYLEDEEGGILVVPAKQQLGQPNPPVIQPSEPKDLEPTRDVIRAMLAGALVFLLGVCLVYSLAMVNAGTLKVTDAKELLSVVVSPLVALVGAATGFYFGEGSRSRRNR